MSETAHKLLNIYTDGSIQSSWLIVMSLIGIIVGVALVVRFVFPLKPSALIEHKHNNQPTFVGALGEEA